MILKEQKDKKKYIFSANKFLLFYFVVTLILGSIILGFIINSYTFAKTKNSFLMYFSKAGRYEYLYLPKIGLEAFKSNFYKINKMDMEIQFEDVLIIENFRKNAIDSGNLGPTELIPRVKANIIFEGKKYRGDIRLKGDRKAHFVEKKKSSYKVELDRNKYLFGIKKFSIQKPRLRNYIHEWIFHEMAKDFNIIKIKYDFVNLSINGENLGLYVIEEGFGKELIERNKRRNGPIFGIDEDVLDDINNPVFEIYNKNYWARPENNSIARIASQKLRDFFNGKESAENIFDLEKWSAYFAVVDMTSNYHGALLKSVKFYYNPINGLFEPIPFDGHRLKPNYHKYNISYDNRILIDLISDPQNLDEESLTWIKRFFFKDQNLNQNFYDLYSKNLATISSKKYTDKFLKRNLKKINEINSHIYSDYFYYDNSRAYGTGLYYFSLNDFFHQAKNIQSKIKIKRDIQVLKENNSEYLIKRHSKHYGELFIDTFICSKNNNNFEININKKLNNFSNTTVYLPTELVKDSSCTHVNFVNKFNGNSTVLKIDHINSDYKYKKFNNPESKMLNNYFVEKNGKLFLKSDQIFIDKNLYIPKGYKVVVKPKQKIILTNNAFIISNSPWTIGGKKGKTIITGEESNLGGGILISDNIEVSKIQNTKFSYLSGINQNLIHEFLILGSINFNQTKAEIEDVTFENIYSEDAVNIFRSSFKIKDNSYKNIISDAIDIDFSNGEISSANFENVKNDAIDFSGSKAFIYNLNFKNVNDKLVSVGENSKIKISKINGINSYAGIVSKDGSEVYSTDINFDGVQIPFAAYQKKKEYNHGSLIVKNYKIKNSYTKWIKDKESNITIDDMSIAMETKKILPIVYEKKLFLLKQ